MNEPEPDLLVARGDDTIYLVRHPEPHEIALIVEVSDTTYRYDRDQKYPAFASAGIPVYWIVNLGERCIEVYTDPSPEGFATRRNYRPGDAIPVEFDGQPLGQIAVNDILPPTPAGRRPERTGTDRSAQRLPSRPGDIGRREGWHGCQMPEPLPGRIIRGVFEPRRRGARPVRRQRHDAGRGQDKKRHRRLPGFALSRDGAAAIGRRVEALRPGSVRPAAGGPSRADRREERTREISVRAVGPRDESQGRS